MRDEDSLSGVYTSDDGTIPRDYEGHADPVFRERVREEQDRIAQDFDIPVRGASREDDSVSDIYTTAGDSLLGYEDEAAFRASVKAEEKKVAAEYNLDGFSSTQDSPSQTTDSSKSKWRVPALPSLLGSKKSSSGNGSRFLGRFRKKNKAAKNDESLQATGEMMDPMDVDQNEISHMSSYEDNSLDYGPPDAPGPKIAPSYGDNSLDYGSYDVPPSMNPPNPYGYQNDDTDASYEGNSLNFDAPDVPEASDPPADPEEPIEPAETFFSRPYEGNPEEESAGLDDEVDSRSRQTDPGVTVGVATGVAMGVAASTEAPYMVNEVQSDVEAQVPHGIHPSPLIASPSDAKQLDVKTQELDGRPALVGAEEPDDATDGLVTLSSQVDQKGMAGMFYAVVNPRELDTLTSQVNPKDQDDTTDGLVTLPSQTDPKAAAGMFDSRLGQEERSNLADEMDDSQVYRGDDSVSDVYTTTADSVLGENDAFRASVLAEQKKVFTEYNIEDGLNGSTASRERATERHTSEGKQKLPVTPVAVGSTGFFARLRELAGGGSPHATEKTASPTKSDPKDTTSHEDGSVDLGLCTVSKASGPPSTIVVGIAGKNNPGFFSGLASVGESLGSARANKHRICGMRVDRLICGLAAVIIVAIAVAVGSVVASNDDSSSTAVSKSGTGSSVPIPSPTLAPTIDVGVKQTTEPPTSEPSPEDKDPNVKSPSAGPTSTPILSTDEPTSAPIESTAQPSPAPTPGPTAWPEECGTDSATAEIFINSNWGYQNCFWLSSRPAFRNQLCVEGNDAYELCRETCRNCSPTPPTSPAPSPALITATQPTPAPTLLIVEDTESPTAGPTVQVRETQSPTGSPTEGAQDTESPTVALQDTESPTVALLDTESPTVQDTDSPTGAPTEGETQSSTSSPTEIEETSEPTAAPVAAPRNEDLRNLIESEAASSTADALNDSSSPQSEALEWLSTDESNVGLSDARLLQRFALATFAFGSTGNRRRLQSGGQWLSNRNECFWSGISCNSSDRVSSINVANRGLKGWLPAEWALLADSLTNIDVSENELSGRIPREWGQLVNLEVLRMERNNFSGSIPNQVAGMANLREWTFFWNDFTGDFPNDIFVQLENLRVLNFYHNDMVGFVSDDVCDMNFDTLILDCREVDCDCWTRCFYQCGPSTGVPCGD